MLNELAKHHEDIERHVRAQEMLLLGSDRPSIEAVARARWKLMAASRRRRDYADDVIYPALDAVLTGAHAEALAALRARDMAQRQWASGHLGRWPIDRVTGEFDAYTVAAVEVFQRMRSYIETERQVLMPLLSPLLARQG